MKCPGECLGKNCMGNLLGEHLGNVRIRITSLYVQCYDYFHSG